MRNSELGGRSEGRGYGSNLCFGGGVGVIGQRVSRWLDPKGA